MIRSGDILSEPDTPSEASEKEADDHEAETHPQSEVAQADTEQAASHQETPHQIQAVDPEIPIQSAPPLEQAAPQTTTTETPATHPSSDDTPSHPA